MNDERITADADPDGAVTQSDESDADTTPAGGFSAAEIDDIVWDAFGSGLSAAYD
jgi:hypothetical protein